MPFLFENNYEKKNFIRNPSIIIQLEPYMEKDVVLIPDKCIAVIDYWYSPTIDAGSYYLQIDNIMLERTISSSDYEFKKGDDITLKLYGVETPYSYIGGHDAYIDNGIPSTDIDNNKSSMLFDDTYLLYFKKSYLGEFFFDMKLNRSGFGSNVTEATLKNINAKLYKIH